MKNTNNDNLKNCVFERIDCEGVCPRSRLFFRGVECFLWFSWFLSVIIGAVAFAVTLYVLSHHQYALYEATHDNYVTFVIDVLPYIWVLMFGLMASAAVYNIRHTKHGYRQPLWLILSSSVLASVLIGGTLHAYKFGYHTDDMLGRHMPMYASQAKLDQKMWQAPEKGRLVGGMIYSTVQPTTTLIFKDVKGDRWRVELLALPEKDVELLSSGETVRLMGKKDLQGSKVFHACGVFPWMLEPKYSAKEMSKERQAFVDLVYNHAHKAKDELARFEGGTLASTTLSTRSVCAEIAAVRRMVMEEKKQ